MTRHGLGYLGVIADQGVELLLDRLYETRGELTGELMVSRTGPGVLSYGRMNLVSSTTRRSTAKDLGSLPGGIGSGVDWRSALDAFCIRVLEMHREGEPLTYVGQAPARPEPPFLVRPLIQEGVATILFGPGGTGKSTLAAVIATAVQTGRDPMDGWTTMRAVPVLVLDWEDDAATWNDMVAEAARGLGVEPPRIAYLRMDGPLDGAVHKVSAVIGEHGVGLVIVDSVENALRNQGEGGGINEPVKRLFGALRMFRTSSLLIDHVSKASVRGDEETDGQPIGGTAKTNRARRTYELRRAGDPEPGVLHLSLINRKVNRTAAEQPVGIQVRRIQGALVLEPEQVRLADPVTARATRLEDRIREVLGRGQRLSAAEIVGRLGLGGSDPERTVRQTMQRKPDVFAMATQKKGPAIWFLVDLDHAPAEHRGRVPEHVPEAPWTPPMEGGAEQLGFVPEHVPLGGRAGGTPPTRRVGGGVPPAAPGPDPDRSAAIVPPADEPGRWDGLIELADRMTEQRTAALRGEDAGS